MKYNIFILLIILISCKKEKFSAIEIYGHAGNGLEIQNSIYHDNSKEAIELALGTEGVSGVEIDVHLSVDGELWLYHDDDLSSETNSSGCIEKKNSSELEGVYYSTIHKEKLVKLSELDFENYGNKTFLIDARHYVGCNFSAINYTQFVSALSTIHVSHPSIKFIVLTRISDWIQDFHASGLEVYYEITKSSEYDELQLSNVQIEGIIIKNALIEKDEVVKIQNDSRKVLIFEVRSPKNIRKAMKKGPNGVLSDDINAAIIEKY